MKAFLGLTLLVLFASVAFSQSSRVTIVQAQDRSRANDIVIADDLLYVVGYALEGNYVYGDGTVLGLSTELDSSSIFYDGSVYTVYFNSAINDGDSLVLFGWLRTGTNVQGLIYKWFDNAQKIYQFGGNDKDVFIDGFKIKNNFYAVGTSESMSEDDDTSTTPQDYCVTKATQFGKPVWESSHGTPGKDKLLSAAVSRDSGKILLAGTSEHYGEFNYPDSSEIFIVLMDTNGSEIWRQVLDYGDYGEISAVCQAHDGSFYFTGYFTITGTWSIRYFLGKIDTMGSMLWLRQMWNDSLSASSPYNKRWGSIDYNSISQFRNGDLLASGADRRVYDKKTAVVTRFTETGDTVWRYDYKMMSFDNEFYNAIEDKQGYVYACGRSTPYIESFFPDYGDVLVVKLDDNGCVIDTCLQPPLPTPHPSDTTDVEVVTSGTGIFPIPFSSHLNVQLQQSDSTNSIGTIICNVYNSVGQRVYRESWNATPTLVTIQTGKLSSGFYTVELQGYGLVTRFKAVKQ